MTPWKQGSISKSSRKIRVALDVVSISVHPALRCQVLRLLPGQQGEKFAIDAPLFHQQILKCLPLLAIPFDT